jgi:hypothetical protein
MLMTPEELDWRRERAAERNRRAEYRERIEKIFDIDSVFTIMPTSSADPELRWAAENGGPLYATNQWHRIINYDDPELDA